MKDNINPDHYKKDGIECIIALEAATVGKTGIEAICVANCVKYLWRYEEKNGLEDIKKAKWYLDHLIKTIEAKNEVQEKNSSDDSWGTTTSNIAP